MGTRGSPSSRHSAGPGTLIAAVAPAASAATVAALTNEGDLFWSSPYTSSGVIAGQRWIRGTGLHTQRTGWVGRDYLTLELST